MAALVLGLSFVCVEDWHAVGIYAGCPLRCRLLYPFFHANLLHAALNAWALLSIVFIYDVSVWRMLLAYVVAVSAPVGLMGLSAPTVGLSGAVYFLFGSLSFEVGRKWYWQAWMLFYLGIGFLFPNTNAWLHLYCYITGLAIALLNKPIEREG